MQVVFLKVREFMMEKFKLEEHTERLFTLKKHGYYSPYTQAEINDACKTGLNVQKVQNGYVRPLIWRGSEMMAISAQTKFTLLLQLGSGVLTLIQNLNLMELN